MGDLSIETKNIPSNDVLGGYNTEIKDLKELKVGSGSSIFYTDKEGSRWGHTTFDDAKAWIKVDGTAQFKTSSGDVLLSTGATDGNFINIINTALNTSTKTILEAFTFGSTDYAGAFKTGNITWNEATGAITGGSGSVYNKNGLVFANAGVPTITLNGVTGEATFAGTLSAPNGTLGVITAGVLRAGPVWLGEIEGHNGISLNGSSDYNNIFFRRVSDGVVFFRVNVGGSSYIDYNSSSGLINLVGTVQTNPTGSGANTVINKFANWLEFQYNGVAEASMFVNSIGSVYIQSGKQFFVDAANNANIFCDQWQVFFNDDNDGSDAHWISNNSEKMKLSSSGNLTVDGDVTADAYHDFGEMFESVDGKKIQVGVSVVLNGNKIRPAKKGEIPIGIISATAGFVLDTGGVDAGTSWGGKYLRNDYGEFVYEEVDFWTVKKKLTAEERKNYLDEKKSFNGWCDESTPPKGAEIRKKKRKKLNPNYDKSKKFIPRKERDEWNIVGLVGKVKLTKGQPIAPNWIKLRDISDTVEEWLIR